MKKTIKIIDLLNKIANDEEVPKKIRIDHWCYKFEWVEHLKNYYDEECDVDLMSALSMDKEELNYGVQIIEEDKKIEKVSVKTNNHNVRKVANKINEIIDEINELKKGE